MYLSCLNFHHSRYRIFLPKSALFRILITMEETLAQHILNWDKEKDLHVERDQVGNILLRKLATQGMENRKPVGFTSAPGHGAAEE